MLGLFKKKPANFFSESEKKTITDAIASAENKTSGEVRVFIENNCKASDPVNRAKDIFANLKMANTSARNGVLVYVAMKDKKLAIYGDKGIHEKVGNQFWEAQVAVILQHFNTKNYAAGIAGIIKEIGEALATHFPYDKTTDTNELSDEIVFGN